MKLLCALLDALIPKRDSYARMERTHLEHVGAHLSPTMHTFSTLPVITLLPYREQAVRALILEAKFHEESKAFSLLGAVLAEYIQAELQERAFEEAHIVVVPVPLSRERLRERGYNQVERIATEALKLLPASCALRTDILRRARNTRPQTSLDKLSRHNNMHDAFAISTKAPSPAHYILLDDVVTTGATLCAAHTSLQAAGAVSIEIVALAH